LLNDRQGREYPHATLRKKNASSPQCPALSMRKRSVRFDIDVLKL
jgi:hypothetical protein